MLRFVAHFVPDWVYLGLQTQTFNGLKWSPQADMNAVKFQPWVKVCVRLCTHVPVCACAVCVCFLWYFWIFCGWCGFGDVCVVSEFRICGELSVYQVCHESGVLMCIASVFAGESSIIVCSDVSFCVSLWLGYMYLVGQNVHLVFSIRWLSLYLVVFNFIRKNFVRLHCDSCHTNVHF